MKTSEQRKPKQLRACGMSMGAIASKLGVSKSSVSYWLRNITLTQKQRTKLNQNAHSIDAIEKRRIARVANTQKKRALLMREAALEVPTLSQNMLWCVGVALYWGEGGKTQQTARLANSDPAVIRTTMRFFRECCKVDEGKFRGHVHTFSHQNAKGAEHYWSSVSGLPTNKFYKTYVKKSIASKHKRDSLPYGTFQIYVHDTSFFFRMMGWIEKIKELQNV